MRIAQRLKATAAIVFERHILCPFRFVKTCLLGGRCPVRGLVVCFAAVPTRKIEIVSTMRGSAGQDAHRPRRLDGMDHHAYSEPRHPFYPPGSQHYGTLRDRFLPRLKRPDSRHGLLPERHSVISAPRSFSPLAAPTRSNRTLRGTPSKTRS